MTIPQDLVEQLAGLISGRVQFSAIAPTQYPVLAELAVHQGLGPLLYWTAKQADVDTTTLQPAKAAAQKAAIHAVLLARTLVEVNTALTQAHIPSLWLKGTALAQIAYPQPELRPMGDLDVLVPYEQRQEALRIVQALGYHDSPDFISVYGQVATPEKLSHHYHLTGGVGDQIILELHYRLLGNARQLLPMEQLAWFWGQTQQVNKPTPFTTLKPEAHLLFLCAHALLQHGEADFFLQRFYDIHLLVSTSTLDWALITTQAAALDWSGAVARGLELARQYFDTPVPPAVITQLGQQTGRDAQRLAIMQGPGARGESFVGQLTGLPLREKLRTGCRVGLPSRAYMRQRYNIPAGCWVAPYYLYRWVDQGRALIAWGWQRLTLRIGRK